MERVHQPESRPWISKITSQEELLQKWYNVTQGFSFGLDESSFDLQDHFCQEFDCNEEEFEELENAFDPNELQCPYEDDIEVTRAFDLPDDVTLETVKSQKADVDKRITNARYKSFQYCSMKFWNYPQSEPFSVRQNLIIKDGTGTRIQLPDVMYTVQIHRPEQAIFRYQNLVPARTPSFHVDQELCVVGCQYLTALRDVISCVSDMAVPGEHSENPDDVPSITMKDVYKSGFFYINGVFYNDMRDPLAKDYSKKILDWWAENPARGVGPFSAKRMEEAKFMDLEIQLGYPYLYMHQGNCEHLIVFCDMRVLTVADPLFLEDYPLINKIIPKKRVFCMVCHIQTAKWVVTKNEKLPEDPYFFCSDCFKTFHYDKHGKKIMDFEARVFIDRSLME